MAEPDEAVAKRCVLTVGAYSYVIGEEGKETTISSVSMCVCPSVLVNIVQI